MNIENTAITNPETLRSLIAFAGVLMSAIISWFISRSTAKNEIRKMKLSWEHERNTVLDQEFDQLISLVSAYIDKRSLGFDVDTTEALQKVAVARTRETGPLAPLLDELYLDLQGKNLKKIDASLSAIIECKRKSGR